MEQQREALLGQIWAAQDEAYDLMYEYDSLPPPLRGSHSLSVGGPYHRPHR